MTEGSCLCGAITWHTEHPLKAAANCHCSMCRKHHGAAFATHARVRRDRLTVKGAPTRYESSANASRSFCGTCGSSLFYETKDDPNGVWIALGTVNGDPGLRAEKHIYVASKAPWFEITDDLPQHQRQP
jgi:hypothetical protein